MLNSPGQPAIDSKGLFRNPRPAVRLSEGATPGLFLPLGLFRADPPHACHIVSATKAKMERAGTKFIFKKVAIVLV